MKRRPLLLAFGASTTLISFGAKAQPPKVPQRIGWLSSFTAENQKDAVRSFNTKLKELGYAEGRDYLMDFRFTEGKNERLPAFARELLALRPAVIVTGGAAAIEALKKETKSVPIVFAHAGGVVEQGLVASLAKPGGNVTGVSLRAEIQGKLLEFVREALPASRRIALLVDQGDPIVGRMTAIYQKAASVLGFEMTVVGVKRLEDLERAFADMVAARAEAVIVPPLSLFFLDARQMTQLAIKSRLPLFATPRVHTAAGGFLSYFTDLRENFHGAASLVDKILRGANPGDLAILQPDRYFLVLNLKTAKALGIKVPQSLLLRADEVIE